MSVDPVKIQRDCTDERREKAYDRRDKALGIAYRRLQADQKDAQDRFGQAVEKANRDYDEEIKKLP